MPVVGGPHTRITNPRWRTAAILEKSIYHHISAAVQPLFTKFGTLVQFNPLDRVKNLKLWKSKMAAAAILKNLKIAISRSRYDRFWRNLAWWCSSTLLTVPRVKNVKFRKSKMAAAAILKNRHILAAVEPIFTKFVVLVQFDPLTIPAAKNLKFWKSKIVNRTPDQQLIP